MSQGTGPSSKIVAQKSEGPRREAPFAAPFQDPAETLAVAGRFTVYSLAILVFMLSLPVIEQGDRGFLFREGGPVEWTQFGLLVATCLLFLVGSLWRPPWRGCFLALATASGLAAVRELDSTLDRAIALGGWKLPAALVAVAGGVAVYRHRDSFLRGAAWLLRDRSFALLWAGFVVAVPFAQLAGHGPFLELVLGDAYHRSQKRLFEELGELVGYVLIFFGAIEAMLAARPAKAHEPPAAAPRSLRSAPPPAA